MITRNFFEQVGQLSVPLLEYSERHVGVQAFLRDAACFYSPLTVTVIRRRWAWVRCS